jgi:hypothetical protein
MGKYEPMKNAGKKIIFDDTPAIKQKDRTRTKGAKQADLRREYTRMSKGVARNES